MFMRLPVNIIVDIKLLDGWSDVERAIKEAIDTRCDAADIFGCERPIELLLQEGLGDSPTQVCNKRQLLERRRGASVLSLQKLVENERYIACPYSSTVRPPYASTRASCTGSRGMTCA